MHEIKHYSMSENTNNYVKTYFDTCYVEDNENPNVCP